MSRIRKQLERGEVSELAIVVVVALFIMIGLVVDGGAKMNAAAQASSTAQEAARVGAQPLESLPSNTQDAQLSAADAAAAAQDYLTQASATGSVQVIDPTTIEVTVTSSEDTVFLGILGIHSVSATHTASVDLIQGQTEVLP